MNRIGFGDTVLHDFPALQPTGCKAALQITLKEHLEQQEAEIIMAALGQNDWNIEQTAKLLGISHASLYRKMNKYKFN